jgi:hypothetical protein
MTLPQYAAFDQSSSPTSRISSLPLAMEDNMKTTLAAWAALFGLSIIDGHSAISEGPNRVEKKLGAR